MNDPYGQHYGRELLISEAKELMSEVRSHGQKTQNVENKFGIFSFRTFTNALKLPTKSQ